MPLQKDKFLDPGNWGSLAAVIGSIIFVIFIVYSLIFMPAPYAPDDPFPSNKSETSPNITLSWVGGNPSNRIIYTVASLFGNRLDPEINYHINIYNKSELVYSGIELGNSERSRVIHKPLVHLKQGSEYSWQVVAENNFGRVMVGPSWRFSTKSAPIINFKTLGHTYNSSNSQISVNTSLNGDLINISYNISKNGHVGIWVPIISELHRTNGIMFCYMGGGSPNTFEIKLGYGDGDNNTEKNETTYQLYSDIKTTDDDWINTPREILYEEFDKGWSREIKPYGFLGTVDENKIRSIHIVFSNKPEYGDVNGTGWVKLYDFRGMVE